MATWVLAVKRRIQAPVIAASLGHFTGHFLTLEVLTSIPEDIVSELMRSNVLIRRSDNNFIVNREKIKERGLPPGLPKEGVEVLMNALNSVGEEDDLLLIRMT